MDSHGQITSAGVENHDSLLQNLPTDVLLLLFNYLGYEDLSRLSISCKRFYSIIKDDVIWKHKSRASLVLTAWGFVPAGMSFITFPLSRSYHNMRMREQVRLSRNWITGRYRENFKLLMDYRYMPWIRLGGGRLWFSKGSTIIGFQRVASKPKIVLSHGSKVHLRGHLDDICRFAYDNGIVVSGGRDCALLGYATKRGRVLFTKSMAHERDVTAVDLRDDTVVSGSLDGVFKVWKLFKDDAGRVIDIDNRLTIPLLDRVWSMALRPLTDECILGLSSFNYRMPLQLYNLERGVEVVQLSKQLKRGAGVLDVVWENENTVLSTGYDTYIRLWDVRTGRNERSWGDPFDSTVYSLATDGAYTVMSGMSCHGRVQLWDKRQEKSVQMYFLLSRYNKNSSVYSLAFDPCNLYAALDQTLNLLDFSGHNIKPIDMRDNIL